MQKDDETTAAELDRLLEANGVKLSRSTILRCRKQLGWTYRGAAYCQLIREPNKLKRLSWCMENQCTDFHNVMVGRDNCPTGEPPPLLPQETWRKATSKTKVCMSTFACKSEKFVILCNGIMCMHVFAYCTL